MIAYLLDFGLSKSDNSIQNKNNRKSSSVYYSRGVKKVKNPQNPLFKAVPKEKLPNILPVIQIELL